MVKVKWIKINIIKRFHNLKIVEKLNLVMVVNILLLLMVQVIVMLMLYMFINFILEKIL